MITDLAWVRERAGAYHSVRLDGERVFYRLMRKGRRAWHVERLRLLSKGRVQAEHVAEAPSLAYGRFLAACDFVSAVCP